MNSITCRGFGLAGTFVLCLLVAVNAGADGIADKITVNDPYVRAVPPVVKTSAAFMQFQNSDAVEHFLVSASTPAAAVVELHTHTMDDGVMRMRQVANIPMPPNETVSLQPGGLHIMLFDLTAPLNPGDQVPIILSFEDGSTKEISAQVRSAKSMMKH